MSGLKVPILRSQLHAAGELHLRLVQWHTTDRALAALQGAFPDWSLGSSLLKIASINQLYGTNLYAVSRMATHVTSLLGQESPEPSDVVDKIADLPKTATEVRGRKHLSFASKLCHFFISSERFPIYDSHAVRVLGMHVGERITRDVGNQYAIFTAPFFRALASAGCSARELDRYLWLRGQFDVWRKNPEKAEINGEVRGLFLDKACGSLCLELAP